MARHERPPTTEGVPPAPQEGGRPAHVWMPHTHSYFWTLRSPRWHCHPWFTGGGMAQSAGCTCLEHTQQRSRRPDEGALTVPQAPGPSLVPHTDPPPDMMPNVRLGPWAGPLPAYPNQAPQPGHLTPTLAHQTHRSLNLLDTAHGGHRSLEPSEDTLCSSCAFPPP